MYYGYDCLGYERLKNMVESPAVGIRLVSTALELGVTMCLDLALVIDCLVVLVRVQCTLSKGLKDHV